VLRLPAIAERDEEFRKEGEALWEEGFPLPNLERIKAQIGTAAFAALYGQLPSVAEGAIFGRSLWRPYDQIPRFIRIVQSWDTAFKTGSENDYSVCTTWGVTASGFFLIDLWRGRVPFPDLKRQVAALAQRFRPHAILVEDRASGQSLVQELKVGSTLPIIPVKVDSDKITRAQAVTPLVEAGRVFIPDRAAWLEVFLNEMAAFPVGRHDDVVDSVVQALAYLRSNDGGERDARVTGEILDYLLEGRRKREREAEMSAWSLRVPGGRFVR
jgi:predicted phage terminase large subunit-like protein